MVLLGVETKLLNVLSEVPRVRFNFFAPFDSVVLVILFEHEELLILCF